MNLTEEHKEQGRRNFLKAIAGAPALIALGNEAYLFSEGETKSTRVEVSRQTSQPVADASATRPADSPGRTINMSSQQQNERDIAYKNEIAEFCSSIRTGKAVRCGPVKAMKSAIAVLTANRSSEKHARSELSTGD